MLLDHDELLRHPEFIDDRIVVLKYKYYNINIVLRSLRAFNPTMLLDHNELPSHSKLNDDRIVVIKYK